MASHSTGTAKERQTLLVTGVAERVGRAHVIAEAWNRAGKVISTLDGLGVAEPALTIPVIVTTLSCDELNGEEKGNGLDRFYVLGWSTGLKERGKKSRLNRRW